MDDVRAVMDAAGSRRTVLVGFSEGCPMSALFAAIYPEIVSHLVLNGGFARSGLAVPDAELETITNLIVGNWGSGQMMKRVVGIADGNNEVLARFGRFERMSCSPGAFKALLRMNSRIDVTQILPIVRIPTLVLHSRKDAVTPISEGRKLAAAIPGAKFVEHDDRPHAVRRQQPGTGERHRGIRNGSSFHRRRARSCACHRPGHGHCELHQSGGRDRGSTLARATQFARPLGEAGRRAASWAKAWAFRLAH